MSPSVLSSYGGREHAETFVVSPTSVDEVQACIARASASGRKLAFRGSGGSLHDQALHDDMVLSSASLPRLGSVGGDVLVATAPLLTGEALSIATTTGQMPPVLPTSGRLSLGGVLASDTVCRASQLWGKFSASVRSADVILGDGRRMVVGRRSAPGSLEDRLFRALPGSMGGLGYVARMELDLLDLPGPGARVESEPEAHDDFESAMDAMVGDYLARPAHPTADSPFSWVVFTDRGEGILLRSRYVDGARALSPLAVHRPYSLINRLGHLAAALPGWAALGARALERSAELRDRPYVDSLEGFTFMMDGNWAMRDALARFGLDVWVLQQSFVLPVVEGDDPASHIKAFLARALEEGPRHGVSSSVMDALMVPPDEAILSSTRGSGGAVISMAYMGFRGDKHSRVVEVFRSLAQHACELGGRVHLAKHAHADPDVLQEMYGEALAHYETLKSEVDPRDVLGGRFLRRLLAGQRSG